MPYLMKFAGMMMFDEITNYLVRPAEAAIAMSAIACVQSHGVGLVDLS